MSSVQPIYVLIICVGILLLGIDAVNETTFTSWKEPPISSGSGSGNASVTVKENHPVGTSTGIKVQVMGGTEGVVSYNIRPGQTSEGIFYIGGITEDEVMLNASLDYEVVSSYVVYVVAVDRSEWVSKTGVATMTINIADINDNPPTTNKNKYSTLIVESTPIGKRVIYIVATDSDGTNPNNEIHFAIADRQTNGDFDIDAASGAIHIARPLMAYLTSKYKMTVLVSDGGIDPHPITTSVAVSIFIIADPTRIRCQPDVIDMEISDNARIGHKELLDIACSNWRGKQLYFVLEASLDFLSIGTNRDDQTYIEIVSTLHNTTWNTNVTVYEEPYRNVTLNRIPIVIRIIAKNDPPTISPLQQNVIVTENAAVGTVIAEFIVHDPDFGDWASIHVYSNDIPEEITIGPINGSTVQLIINSPLDVDKYKNVQCDNGIIMAMADEPINSFMAMLAKGCVEVRSGHITVGFAVVVEDKLGLNATSKVNLSISDINDNPPVCILSTVMIKVPRDISTDATILDMRNMCSDADYSTLNNYITYIINEDNCAAFHMRDNQYISKTYGGQFNESVTSCTLIVNVEDSGMPALSTQVTVIVEFLECPADTDYMGIAWTRGIPNKNTWGGCPEGHTTGWAIRYCDNNGVYHDPVYNCTSDGIAAILNKVINTDVESSAVVGILDDLVNATSTNNNSLLIGDMESVHKVMETLTHAIDVNSPNLATAANYFVEVVNNIISDETRRTWKALVNETGSGANTVLEDLDHFVEKIATAITERNGTTTEFAKSNIFLKIGLTTACEAGIQFPDRGSGVVPAWASETLNSVDIACANKSRQRSYSSAIYRDLSEIMPIKTTDNKTLQVINAPVMSFAYFPKTDVKLETPVEITFQLYDNVLDDPSCSFWTRDTRSLGAWSMDGCWLHLRSNEKNTVVCKCDHLTNFALLMSSATIDTDDGHHVALSIISIVGCIVSMACLLLTILIYIIYWRIIKSVRSIIHINLAGTLFVAYLLFIAGVRQTENKDLCTAIAMLIHFVYLVVFFIMLTEGLNVAYNVLKPFSTRKPGIPLLIASYVMAACIVVVSAGAVRLEGYGNESFCWLSIDTGLIWAFIAPVFVIILINCTIIGLVIRKMCGTIAMSKKTDTEKARIGIRSILVLMPIMGVTWVFGIFSVNEHTVVFQYLFAIFNSLQGLLIFIFHCVMNRKIKEAFRKHISSTWQSTKVSSCADAQSRNTTAQATQVSTCV